jgi:hypothetical protein
MAYTYTPLSDPAQEIRVASLQPGAYDDEVRVSFHLTQLRFDNWDAEPAKTKVLSSIKSRLVRVMNRIVEPMSKASTSIRDSAKFPGKTFEYEALSYVWGPKDNPSYVQVFQGDSAGGSISITRNLDIALRHLRQTDRPRLVWIDALCIDQSNDHEKSTQVAIMSRIFRLASCVIAWLGPKQENSDDALALMKHWARNVEADRSNYRLRSSKTATEPHWGDRNIHLPYQSGELAPVCSLLGRPYFSRLWVRQELLCATQALVQCGAEQIPWEDFRTAIICLCLKPWYWAAVLEHQEYEFQRVRSFVYNLCITKRALESFSGLRLSFRDTQCKDPLDRLYAVLSLLGPDQELGVEPDYSLKPEQLYVNVAHRATLQRKNLDILETCELSSKSLNIPTWVPDWSSRLDVRAVPFRNWSASAWISARPVIEDRMISVTGVRIGRIKHVTRYYLPERGERTFGSVVDFIRQTRPSLKCSATPTSRKSSDIDAYCRTLICNRFADSYVPRRIDLADLEKSTRIIEFIWSSTAEDLEVVALNTAEKLNNKMHLADSEMFLEGRCFFTTREGFVGLAPSATQEDDIICVLLGCVYPVMLRPFGPAQWQVVGVCYADGFMSGEAIYGAKLPDHYRPVERVDAKSEFIDGWKSALLDSRTQRFETNPAKVLEEMGIKVEKYQREPLLLEVSPETLRAAGVDLETFTLV